MKKTVYFVLAALILAVAFGTVGCSDVTTINIDSSNIGVTISDNLYGLFLEDISYACDGGLVSELINNGSFEYSANPTTEWRFDGLQTEVASEDGLNDSNKNYLQISVSGNGSATNLGFVEYYDYLTKNYNTRKMNTADMGFSAYTDYAFSCYVKNTGYSGSLKVKLDTPSNQYSVIELPLPEVGTGWQKLTATLRSRATEDGGLTLMLEGNGSLCIDFVSLNSTNSYGYGTEHWKYTTLRSDLFTALKNLSPSFIRFPGGCLAEGDSLENLFDWKKTIGSLETRTQFYNIWNEDEKNKSYNNTFAMGYHEYFQLASDLNAKPLPILNAGMICQFEAEYNKYSKLYKNKKLSSSEWEAYLDTVALRPNTPAFDAYVQDVYDLIEYANGDTSTYWGAQRAANGSLEPFNLEYVGIGNENWGELYWRNFDALYTAIKARYPQITVISSASYQFDGDYYDEAWQIINEKYTDTLVDEHYYTNDQKLFKNNDRYDYYDRNGAKVFLGEYAAKSTSFGKYVTKGNIWSTIEEAGYLTGIERNGDIVDMVAYAPTFAKVNSQCWDINLIWFDSQNVALTPNYFAQMLFANNVGKQVINTDLEKKGCYSTVTIDRDTQQIFVKLVNSKRTSFDLEMDLSGFGNINAANVQYVSDDSKAACNEIGSTTVIPQQKYCEVSGSSVVTTVDGLSVNVIRIFYGDNDGSTAYKLPDIPSTMEQTVTDYNKPYMTYEAWVLVSIFVFAPTAALCLLLLLRIAKRAYVKKRSV